MKALRAAAAALRDFLRGFVGLPAPPAGGAPRDVRRAVEEQAARRPRCC
jgi:hypothetical protein